MGKGDKKTKRGKIILGSYGVSRRKHPIKSAVLATDGAVKEKAVKAKAVEVSDGTAEEKKAAKKTTASKTTKKIEEPTAEV